MENNPAPAVAVALPLNTCTTCNINVSADDTFCNNCGYPLKGTQEEQQAFRADLTSKEIDLADYHEKIKVAGQRLYITAGLFFLGSIFDLVAFKNDPAIAVIMIIDLIICGIFVALGGWSRKKPFAALVSGITFYGILVILIAINDPASILKGIYLKIIIIGALIQGIKAAIEAEKIKKDSHLQ